jgi:hypothetical protein
MDGFELREFIDSIPERLESYKNVDRRDFYTDGVLDLEKAKARGKLHLIRAFTFNGEGKILDVKLYNDYFGCVYLIQASNGQVKIGWARDLAVRLMKLQVANPLELRCLGYTERVNAPDLEKELHRRFKAKRLRGEWFSLSQEDIAVIRREYEFLTYDG